MRVVWQRMKSWWPGSQRRSREADLQRELQTHLELEAEDQAEVGMSPEEAHYAARRALGNTTQIKEDVRLAWGFQWLETLNQDLRYGLRQLRRNPGFAAVAIITLALGIGANTAIFSVVDTVLLRPLPYKDSGRLVVATEQFPAFRSAFVLSPDFASWRDHSKDFQWIGGFGAAGAGANLTGGERPARVSVTHVTAGFFRKLGVQPVLGRVFTANEGKVGQNQVALISEGLWRTRFGTDRHALGKTIHLDGAPYTVVGVMPERVPYPDSDVWTPIALNGNAFSPHSPTWTILTVVGRLKRGVDDARAQADLSVITHRMDREYPPPMARARTHWRVKVIPLRELLVRNVRPLLLILLGAVGLVLLIACANVANLLLARAAVRGKEIAVRSALGAGRLRLVRQLFTESLLLAVMGGLLGFFAGLWTMQLLKRLIPPNLSSEISLDPRVFGFVIGIAALAVILFGLVPALVASRSEASEALKEGGIRTGGSRRARRLRNLLVVGEIALSLVLLTGAGLLARSFLRLTEVPLGFDPHHVLLADVYRSLRFESRNPLQNQAIESAFFHDVLERVRALPEVEDAAATTHYPVSVFNGIGASSQTVRGAEPTQIAREVSVASISPDYFRTIGIRLLKGRFFDDHDVPGATGIVILNESLARTVFHGRDPVGQQVSIAGAKGPWKTVVGVAADTRNYMLSQQAWPEIFLPYAQRPYPFVTLVVRARRDPLELAGVVTKMVQSLDKNQPVSKIQTMDELVAESVAPQRFKMLLLGLFALLALFLAAVGIYGVMSYSVSQRTHEIGVRMALGAQKNDVLRVVVGQGMVLALIGVGVGISAALVLTRLLASLLYGVKPTDLLTFAAVSLILIGVALLACYIPARRAAKVEPIVALRHE